MGDFTKRTNNLFREISQKYATVQTRGRNINQGVQQINQQIRAAFDLLRGFDQRIASIVGRIRSLNLRGLSQQEKDNILRMLQTLNDQADEVGREVQDLPQEITELPQGIQQRIQEINNALDQIDQALTEVESRSDAGGGGGGGGGGAANEGRDLDVPFPDVELQRLEREQGTRPGQAGGKKRRKTRRKRKGRKARKTRQGGYVIPNKRTHSAKGKKTPVAGKKGKNKKSRK